MENELSKAKHYLRPLVRVIRDGCKVVLVFVYHHIGEVNQGDPFSASHTVSEACLKRQISLLSRIGRFVTLDEIREARNLGRINFALTFDGVSTSILLVKPYLESRAIPYAICPSSENTTAKRAYLTWDDIRNNFLDNRLVTIVNHSSRHAPMTSLSPSEIWADVARSIDDFQTQLDFQPAYFAVPFGEVQQDLALDLMDVLYEHNYRGVLWTNGGGNRVKDPYRAQMIHLSRIIVPPNLAEFIKILLKSIDNSHTAIIEYIQPAVKHTDFEIIASKEPRPALIFENLVRQGKDYSSDLSIYNYYYQANPFRQDFPDYHAVVSSGRLEATIYELHYPFSLGPESVKGSYFCSWRKLPVSNNFASGQLLLKMLETEPIVGGSSTNPLSSKALRSWKKIPLKAYRIRNKKRYKFNSTAPDYTVEEYDQYPDTINSLTFTVNNQFYFSIERTPNFYQWRFDQYPRAKPRYFVLFENEKPVAYFVTLRKDNVLSISDFFSPGVGGFSRLFDQVLDYCFRQNLFNIYIETSRPDIAAFIENNYRSKPKNLFHYYYFNPEFPEIATHWEKLEHSWEQLEFHETQACGDVLLF